MNKYSLAQMLAKRIPEFQKPQARMTVGKLLELIDESQFPDGPCTRCKHRWSPWRQRIELPGEMIRQCVYCGCVELDTQEELQGFLPRARHR